MKGWTVDRWLQVATFTGVAVAFIFGLGVQWNETQQVKANQKATDERITREYVRADVYNAEQRRLSEAIERLTRVLESQQSQSQSESRGPRVTSPTFGR